MPRWFQRLCLVVLLIALPATLHFGKNAAQRPGPSGSRISVVDSSGRPVSAAKIRVEGNRVLVEAPGFATWSADLASGRKPPSRVVLLRSAVLRGRVTSSGARITGFAACLKKEQGRDAAGPECAALADESYEFRSLRPGLRIVAVEADGFVPVVRSVSLREAETRWLDFDLRPAASLEATLLNAEGKPLRGVEAAIRTEDADGRFLPEEERKRIGDLRPRSDEKGKLVLGPLSQGLRHRVVFTIKDYPPTSLVLTPTTSRVSREIRLPAGGTLRLLLVDAKKRPVAGVRGLPSSDDARDVDLLPEPQPSGKDGSLGIGPLPSGTYSVRLLAEGFRPRTLRGGWVKDGTATDLGEIQLEPGLEISGTVRDEEGSSVPGVAVRARFYEEGRRLTAESKTNREGEFRITGLPKGEVEVRMEAKGFFPDSKEQVVAGTEDLELTLTRAGSIAGQVLAGDTLLPVPLFTLVVWPEHWEGDPRGWRAGSIPSVFADAEGRFRVDGLRPEKYHVTVQARGYKPGRLEGVEARSGEPEPVDVRLEAGLALEGAVLDAETRSPVAGATVRASDLPSVDTDREGAFRIEGIEGKTQIEVRHPRYQTEVVTDVEPSRARRLEIQLHRGGAVEGTAYGDDGEPVPGAEVSAGPTEGWRSTLTDAAGRYRLDGLPVGKRLIGKADVPGTYRGYEVAFVEIRPDQTAVQDFGRGARLFGVVTHEGAPASDTRLTLALVPSQLPSGTPAMGSRFVRSREDGSYEARGLRPGTYGLTLIWEERKVGTQVTLPEGTPEQRLDIDIPELWISGAVVDRDTGLPLKGTVGASRTEGQPASSYTSVVSRDDGEVVEFSSNPRAAGATDEHGRFRLPLLETGVYLLRADARGYRMEEPVEVEVKTSRGDLVLALAPAIALSVRALEAATGKALDPRCVSVVSGSSSSTNCGNRPGQLSSLRSGPVLVGVGVPGYAIGYRSIELKENQEDLAVPVTASGNLRLLLPPGVPGEAIALRERGLRLEDESGIDLIPLLAALSNFDGPWLSSDREGQALLRHLPPGPLKVRLGADEGGQSPRQAEATLVEGSEALADLR